MDDKLRQEMRETLDKFTTGVQLAVTMSCFAVGASLGTVVVSGSELAGTLWGLAVVLVIGIIAGATASYWMYRAESGQAEPPQQVGGGDRGYQGDDEADDGGFDF